MLIFKENKFIKTAFDNEAELEKVVIDNYEYLFGPNSFYLSKSKIMTAGGIATIPDGFAIDIAEKRWYLVEAELVHHNLWNHIAPQVTKQLLASQRKSTKKRIIELSVEQYKNNTFTKEKFDDFDISEIDVHRYLEDILENDPIIGLPIDGLTEDLKDWAITFKYKIKLWEIRKFVEFKNPTNVVYEFPEEFKPALDTDLETEEEIEIGAEKRNVSISDLIDKKLLDVGQKLTMSYKPRNGQSRNYESEIREDGSLAIMGRVFSSPSYAAVYGMQNAGSLRQTANGWDRWKTFDGKTLATIRKEYLKLPVQEF